MKLNSLFFSSFLFVSGIQPVIAQEDIASICENSALVAGAAFSEASSRGYERHFGLKDFELPYELSVLMGPNHFVRSQKVYADINVPGRFLIDYVVSMEVASGKLPLAKVKMVAYKGSKGQVFCILTSVSSIDQE